MYTAAFLIFRVSSVFYERVIFMGFFDPLKKIVNAAESVSKQLNTPTVSPSAASEKKPAAPPASPVGKTPQDIIDSGNIPAKKSVLIEDEYGDKKYTFSLSGDFIEFNSHCELDPSYQYEPYSSREFAGSLENYPGIFIDPHGDVYDAVENDRPVGTGYEKLDNKYFAFKTRLAYYGEHLYCYAFRDSTAREREMFGLTYNKDIEGTPLEKSLWRLLTRLLQHILKQK